MGGSRDTGRRPDRGILNKGIHGEGLSVNDLGRSGDLRALNFHIV